MSEPVLPSSSSEKAGSPNSRSSWLSSFTSLLLNAAIPMVWGGLAALGVVMLLNGSLKQSANDSSQLKLATVDIAKVMQEYHERVLRDPNDQNAVNWALEESARAADQTDVLLKHLSTDIHPGYILIQPQALAYQSAHIPDFTDEFRVLLLKRTGKFNALNRTAESKTDDNTSNPANR